MAVKRNSVSFVNVDVVRLFIVFLLNISLMLNMSVVRVIPMLLMRLRMVIFQQFRVQFFMLVNCLFLLDGINGMLHLAYLLSSFVPDMRRIKLMVVNFIALSL